jgi:hypothetical protein
MAELMDKPPVDVRLPLRRIRRLDGGKGEHYPYDAWADGQWRTARQGTDYLTNFAGFRSAISRWAKRYGLDYQVVPGAPGTGCCQFRIEPLSAQQVSTRSYSYGPILYDFFTERGYVGFTEGEEASLPIPGLAVPPAAGP